MNVDKKALGNRIRHIRKGLGLTLEEFGKLIDNASKSNVSKWEKGLVIPNNFRLKLIAKKGNTHIEELLFGSMFNFIGMNFKNLLTEEMKKYTNIITGEFIREISDELENNNVSISNIEDIKSLIKNNIPLMVNQVINELNEDIKFISNHDRYFQKVIANFEANHPIELYRSNKFVEEFLYGIDNLSLDDKIKYSSLIEDIKVFIDDVVNNNSYFTDTYAFVSKESSFIESINDLDTYISILSEKEEAYYRVSPKLFPSRYVHFDFLIKMESENKEELLNESSTVLLTYLPKMDYKLLEQYFKGSVVALIHESKIIVGTINDDMIFKSKTDTKFIELNIEKFNNHNNIFPVLAIFF